VIPQWPTLGGIHNTSDELNNANAAFLYGELTETSVTDIYTGTGLTANRYADVRRSNIALAGINGSALPEETKNILKGQFFFLRAYTYFKLVRLYGGVPLVFQAQGVDDENIQVPRSKTSECIDAIAKDLDSAAILLPKSWTGSNIGKVTRAAALAVKGKALLYLASPQFNPTNIASRWQAAYTACKAAYDACVADGYILHPSYGTIFTTEDNKEVLLVRKYNTAKNLGTNLENITRPYSESTGGSGSNQPTWNLVKAYLKSDGLPTNATSGVAFNDTTFWTNRDPRFAVSIAFNGDVWALSGKANRKQWTYKSNLDEISNMITGFYCKRFCNPSLSPAQAVYVSDAGGGNGMDWIEMRFAEVILNLAECANEVGNLTEAKDMVRLIRKRAGIIQGTADYGLDIATNIPTMRSLLLNERQIEFALEGMRNADLRRTRNLTLITPRLSYIVTPKSPYFAGLKPTSPAPPPANIYLDQPDAFGVKPKDTISTNSINNKLIYSTIFTINSSVPVSIETSGKVISMPDKYYAYPLPNALTQTPAIQQTLGWSGGSFNPFD
jgi:starch-binding outer membrane protein, SusD/RagB family